MVRKYRNGHENSSFPKGEELAIHPTLYANP